MRIIFLAVFLLGCPGDDKGASIDAPKPVDAAVDAAPDAGPCGAEQFVTGELIDFDSSTAAFMGVNNAVFTLRGMPSKTDTTAPNGRFELCAPATPSLVFDLEAPGTYLDGVAYIEAQALGSFLPISFRGITQARAASFYTSRGLTFDNTRAHVLVFLTGDRGTITLGDPHDPAQSGNDDGMPGTFSWTTGDGGRYVLFPNVVATSTTILSGDLMGGPHTIPVAAGKLTVVAISFVFI